MTPAPNRRQRTGNRRCGVKCHRSRLQRHLQLSHAQVGFMATLQHECLYRGGIALIYVLAIPPEEHQAAQPSRNIRFNSWDLLYQEKLRQAQVVTHLQMLRP